MDKIETQLERLAEHLAAQEPAFSIPTPNNVFAPRRVARRHRAVTGVAAACLAVALVVGGWLWLSGGDDPTSVRTPASPSQQTVPRWVITPVAHHGKPHAVPGAVSCADATHCVAVRSYGGGPGGIETLSRDTWSVIHLPSDGTLSAVSCADATHCVAVGQSGGLGASRTLIETFSDGTWSVTPSPSDGVLSSVSCPDANHCVAVGNTGGFAGEQTARTLIETFSDGTWSVTPSPSDGVLSSVSCPDATHCVAVGQSGGLGASRTLIETFSDGTWSVTPSPSDGVLSSVSCPDTTHCVAVGNTAGVSAQVQALIETFLDGTWSVTPSPNPSRRPRVLTGVSCSDTNHCVTVGNINNVVVGRRDAPRARTVIETFSDGTWSITPSPNRGTLDNALRGVSCPDATHCVAVGGFRTNKNDVGAQTLIETVSNSR